VCVKRLLLFFSLIIVPHGSAIKEAATYRIGRGLSTGKERKMTMVEKTNPVLR